jgi:hypothetical protein
MSVGVHSVYLIVTDSVGIAVSSNTATITVNAPLIAKILPASAATDIGVSITLTSNITGGMSPYGFKWYENGSLVSGVTKASFTLTPSSTGTYYISFVVTDSFGFTNASNIATVKVNQLPSVVLSPASASIPLDQNQTFTATVTAGTSPYHYQWYIGGVLEAQTSVPTFTFTATNVSRYYLLYVTITDFSRLNATSNVAVINGHDVAVTAVAPVDNVGIGAQKTVFGQGLPMGINVTAADPGYYSETFTIAVYANSTLIVKTNVTLSSGGTILITLAATANLPYGYYTISADALPVAGEVNLANNVAKSTTTITVSIPGDVTGQGFVNLKSLGLITGHWKQTVPPAPGNADVNGDGLINLKDLGYVTGNWKKSVTL